MTSQLLDKLKPVFDITLLSKFDINELKLNSFAPVCIDRGSVCVLVNSLPNTAAATDIIIKKLNTDKIKFKQIPDSDFDEILSFVNQQIGVKENDALSIDSVIDETLITDNDDDGSKIQLKVEDDISENVEPEVNNTADSGNEISVKQEQNEHSVNDHNDKFFSKKIGEILVEMGFVTNDQIFNALVESKKTHIPLGTYLVQQGLITLQDLKTALTAQQGYDTVSADQLKIPESVISMLPEDFIKMNKVIPISYDDKVLVVGMVNPNDKKVINDIIFLTGLKPTISIITHFR